MHIPTEIIFKHVCLNCVCVCMYENNNFFSPSYIVLQATTSRRLTLLYLANDVIQNSKRKGTEFKMEFVKALPRALHLVAK